MDWGRLANLSRPSSTDVNAPAQSKNCLHQPQRKRFGGVGALQRMQGDGRRVEEEEGDPGRKGGYDPNLNEKRLMCVWEGGRREGPCFLTYSVQVVEWGEGRNPVMKPKGCSVSPFCPVLLFRINTQGTLLAHRKINACRDLGNKIKLISCAVDEEDVWLTKDLELCLEGGRKSRTLVGVSFSIECLLWGVWRLSGWGVEEIGRNMGGAGVHRTEKEKQDHWKLESGWLNEKKTDEAGILKLMNHCLSWGGAGAATAVWE